MNAIDVCPQPELESRFWSKVQKTAGCWLWIGALNKDGYGLLRLRARHQTAHRISWELANGPIPHGLLVLHDCPGGDNRACVNPAHLWSGTHADNMRDAWVKGRHHQAAKTSCVRGHEFTEASTYRTRSGWRVCRPCANERARSAAQPLLSSST